MASEIRLRLVSPDEQLSEEEVVRKDPENPFLSPGQRPEPYRSYYIAYVRLEPVFAQANVRPPLLADTPRGRGLVWRWWPNEMGIVLFTSTPTNDGKVTLDDRVTFMRGEETANVILVTDSIALNPPKWG